MMEKHYFQEGKGKDPKACLKCGRPKTHDIHPIEDPIVRDMVEQANKEFVRQGMNGP